MLNQQNDIIDRNAFQMGSEYAETLATELPRSRDWKSADDAPSAVDVYRNVLARQPDNSVVFVSVGSMANISNLLKSEADVYSDLDATYMNIRIGHGQNLERAENIGERQSWRVL